MAVQISTFIIACNEADRIGPVIESAQEVSDEVIVVDSGSTDDTVAISEKLGARVVHNNWPGYGPQKRFAEELCRNDWLLNLDADEVLSSELVSEIQTLADGAPSADAYRIGIAEVYPGETVPASYVHAIYPVRLYRLSKGRYSASTVYDRVELAGDARVARLKGRIHHFSVRSLREEIGKLLSYTNQLENAEENRERHISGLRVIAEFPLSFLKAYVLRRHFLRGTYGYAISVNFAYYRHMRVVQMYERRRNAKAASDQRSDV